jgi:dihydrofolate reductase
MKGRQIIVHIAASADGYIARPDGNLDWLTGRRPLKGFYGLPKFIRSVDAKILGRTTFDMSLKLGARFTKDDPHYVFSRRPAPEVLPPGVEFVSGSIAEFAKRLRTRKGKHIWMMGGGQIIASFLDAGEIDDLYVTVIPVLLGDGIPLYPRHRREVPLHLENATPFQDGVVQLHYRVPQPVAKTTN